jgi:hypothetical protein
MPQVDPATIDKFRKAYGQIIVKSWSDPAFARRLQNDPKAVLREFGIEVPADLVVKVTHTPPNEMHLAVPPKPGAELDEEHLKQVAGGATMGTAGSMGTAACPVSSASTMGTAFCAG